MGSYILCQTPRAERPFYLSSTRTNIYSLEELCYFLVHNLYLADESVFNEELLTWLESELGLARLAQRLRPVLGRFADIQDLIYPVLKEINYLTYEEMKECNARILAMNQESAALKKKHRGDQLADNRILVGAIRSYQSLLSSLEQTEEGKEYSASDFALIPVLYHNLGCAYARLFQMDKAVECFFSAFERSGRPEDLKTYLLAFRSIRTPLEYESRLEELSVDAPLRKEIAESLDRFARKPEVQVYEGSMDETLKKLTEEYHRSTGS